MRRRTGKEAVKSLFSYARNFSRRLPRADAEGRAQVNVIIAHADEYLKSRERRHIDITRKVTEIATAYGQIDGDHHKAWVIDQIMRAVKGDSYDQWVREYCAGDDGPDTYEWDPGVAP